MNAWKQHSAAIVSQVVSGKFDDNGTENSTFWLPGAVEVAAFVLAGDKTAIELHSSLRSLFPSVRFPLSVAELLLMELVSELKECLSRLEAVTTSLPVAFVSLSTWEVDMFSSILVRFDFCVTGEEVLPSRLLSLGLLEELELESPLEPFLSFFDFWARVSSGSSHCTKVVKPK